jgi:hypothetical protein
VGVVGGKVFSDVDNACAGCSCVYMQRQSISSSVAWFVG